jgi:hypothetical protein
MVFLFSVCVFNLCDSIGRSYAGSSVIGRPCCGCL